MESSKRPAPFRYSTTRPRSSHAVCLALAAILALAAPVHAQLTGNATIADGDTLRVGTTRVRLHGIDAPELAQTCRARGREWPCGRQAAAALRNRIAGGRVHCEERDRDAYGRIVAVCRAGGGDVNAWMANEGWALAYRRYSRDYVQHERAAQAAGRGIWRGDFVMPWDWRRGARLRNEGPADSPSGCRIKGNINRKGDRIYHVPGGISYEATRIDGSRGERWFCSEDEARRAGWRRAPR